nr:MAG TPA: hypothetical protein [Caudoviricetes sp.]
MIKELRFDYRQIVYSFMNDDREEIFSEDSGTYPFIPEINDAIVNLRQSKTDYIKLPTCESSGVVVYDSLLIEEIRVEIINDKKTVVFYEHTLGDIFVDDEDNLIFLVDGNLSLYPLTLKELKEKLKERPFYKYEKGWLQIKLEHMTESYPDYQEIKELIEGL